MIEVGIIMGSQSDWEIMKKAAQVLDEFQVSYEVEVVSAHRTPFRMVQYAKEAVDKGLKVIIAGAGGAAHLPGMVASVTPIPVIGVPIKSSNSIEGIDSLLSIVQMPKGVPVATVAINGAENAGLLAVKILATSNKRLLEKFRTYQKQLELKVEEMNRVVGCKKVY